MSWEKTKLTDICHPKQWKTIAMKDFSDSGYTVYGANGKIGFYTEYTHSKPTLMVTCRGATCGAVNISEPYSYITGNAMALDKLDESRVNLKYLFYFLSMKGFSNVINGSAQPQITRSNLSKYIIPLPPLAEQQRIAAILDKADSLRAKRRAALAKLDTLLQSVFLDMFGDPVNSLYPIEKLSTVCELITDGTHKTPTYVDNGVPFLRVTDIQTDDILWSKTKKIPYQEHVELCKRCKPQKGDIVYSKNGTIGIPKLVDWEEEFSIFVSLCLLRPKQKFLLGNYLETFLETPFALRQAVKHTKTGTVSNLHLVEIRKIELPIPPIEVQQEWLHIKQKIKIEKIKVSKATAHLDSLFHALQQRAFKGEL